jgi:hypothetical protein
MRKQRSADTSAGRAAAEIGEQIERLRRRQRDSVKLELAFRKAYSKLWSADLIRNDAVARLIMLRIAGAHTLDQLERQVHALARRVDELDPRAGAQRRAARATVVLRRLHALESHGDPYAETAPKRTFIAL